MGPAAARSADVYDLWPVEVRQPGDTVGRYRIDAHVSTTAHAIVYRALGADGRRVALKELLHADPRLRREAEVLGRLNHPNIVPVVDAFEDDGRLWLAREWVDGESLQDRLERVQRLPVEACVRLATDLAAGLAEAHRQGVLHRDVKPSNILIGRDGVFRLSDFGALGKLDAGTGRTRSGEISGTLWWMAPEQVSGASQSPATDVFGLGLVLFRCTYGRDPDEAATNVADLLRRRTSEPIHVPASPLHDAIDGCLQLREQDRSTIEVLVRRLRLVEGAAGAAPPPAAMVPPAGDRHVAAPDRSLSIARPWIPAGVALIAAIVVVALLMGGVAPIGGVGSARAWSTIGQIIVSVGVGVGAVALARILRRRWREPAPEAEQRATAILFGAQDRSALTQSLVIEVDALVGSLRTLDNRILGMTMVAMLHEYETGNDSGERQTALLNIVELMEKVQARLAPWHVRHRDAITLTIGVVGAATGVAGTIGALVG